MSPHVGLLVTCLVDLLRPSVGFSAIQLLELAGCRVSVPRLQTCCGQPAYNIGDCKTSTSLAYQIIETFQSYDYVVTPSGSCAAMLRKYYLSLLSDPEIGLTSDLKEFSQKVYELCTFLVEVCKVQKMPCDYVGRITYHDSCSGLRDLGIQSAPRKLLSMIKGADVIEMENPESCCGFGGFFSDTYCDISNSIVSKKIQDAEATHANLLVGGDLGCLLHISGKLARTSLPIECRHIAEVLAGNLSDPPLAHG